MNPYVQEPAIEEVLADSDHYVVRWVDYVDADHYPVQRTPVAAILADTRKQHQSPEDRLVEFLAVYWGRLERTT